MGELARESVLHALVAAFVLGALTRTWGVEHPRLQVRFGLLAVAIPVVAGPLLHLLAPVRSTDAFREGHAVFDSARWNDVRVFGAGLADLGLVLAAVLGLVLLCRDLVPWLQDLVTERPRRTAATEGQRARGLLAGVARRMGRTPPLVVVDEEMAVLHCSGVRRPVVVISSGAVASLDDAELEGALAHEIAHLERKDPALGWALMAARIVFWFNPVVQVLARAVTQQIERRADDRAAEVTGDRVALASALLKVFRATDGADAGVRWSVPGLDSGGRAVSRFRAAALEARCRRLLDFDATEPPERRVADLQVLLAAVGVSILLFFVV